MKLLRFSSSLFLIFIFSNSLSAQNKFVLVKDRIVMDSSLVLSTTQLNLSHLDLVRLPINLNEFENLKSINLSFNNLETISGLGELKNIEELDLSYNRKIKIDSVLVELTKLRNIERLNFSNSELTYLPSKVFEISSLKYLNISFNELEVLPAEIKKLEKLEELNVNNNKLKIVNPGIHHLFHLERIKIYNNNIRNSESLLLQLSVLKKLYQIEIDDVFIDSKFKGLLSRTETLYVHNADITEGIPLLASFSSLKKVVITTKYSGDYDLVFSNLEYNKSLKTLQIKDDELTVLPNSIVQLNGLESISIQGVLFKNLPTSIGRVHNLKSFSIDGGTQFDLSNLLKKLEHVNSLKNLSITNCNLNIIGPEIKRLNQIEWLNLSTNKINEIPHFIGDLESLKYLVISNNDVVIEDINAIQSKNPKLEITYNQTIRRIDLLVKPPIPASNIMAEKFIVDGFEPGKIVTKTGSEILIPRNAFLDKDGMLVKGRVDLAYREFYNPVDMVFSGLPMSFKSDESISYFSSAGMIELRAYKNGEELYSNPDSQISINMVSYNSSDEYDLYFLNANQKGWENIGKDSITVSPQITEPINSVPIAEIKEMSSPNYPEFPYRKERINVSYKCEDKLEHCVVNVVPSVYNKTKYGKRSTDNQVFSDLKTLNKFKWKIDGNRKEVKKWKVKIDSVRSAVYSFYWIRPPTVTTGVSNFDSINYTSSESELNLIEDCWIEPNPKKDNFSLCLKIGGETIKIPVLPSRMGTSPESTQKRFKDIYSTYSKALALRRKDWETVQLKAENYLKNYESLMSEYQEKLRVYQLDLKRINAAELKVLNSSSSSQQNIVRSFTLDGFGYYNCDILQRLEQPKELLAKLVDSNNVRLKIINLYVIDNSRNGIINFESKSKAFFSSKHQNGLIAILPNNKVGVLPLAGFDNKKMNNKSNKAVLQVYDMNSISIEALKLNAGLL